MRAALLSEPGTVVVGEVPEPEGTGGAVLRVDQVGLCGTDVKIVDGKIPVAVPRVLGHEMLGEIVKPADGFPFAVGDRVLVDPGISCGWCDVCAAGRPNICRNGGLLGRDIDGVFTEYIVVPGNKIIAVPDAVSAEAGGLLQVLGTCVHAVKRLSPFPGQVAAVVGLGVAGQLIAQLLRLSGVTVVGITRSRWKRELAESLGAAATAAPDEAAAVLDEVTGSKGPAIVVEAVGTEATMAQSIELATIGGEVLVFGTVTDGSEGLPYYQLYFKELTIHNPRASVVADYMDAVSLAGHGSLRLEPLITHVVDLDDAAEAFDLVNEPSSLKVLMRIG